MNLEMISGFAQVFIALAAIIGIFISIIQQRIMVKQLKTEVFIRYSSKYSMSPEVSAVVKYLEHLDGLKHRQAIVPPDSHDIEIFMHYFEEIEHLINAGIMDEQMVYEMFSYYLFVFENNVEKFDITDYKSDSWSKFRHLLIRMKNIQTKNNKK